MREDPTVKDCFKEAHCTKYIKKLNQKMIGKWKLEEYLDSHDGNGYSHNWQKAKSFLHSNSPRSNKSSTNQFLPARHGPYV